MGIFPPVLGEDVFPHALRRTQNPGHEFARLVVAPGDRARLRISVIDPLMLGRPLAGEKVERVHTHQPHHAQKQKHAAEPEPATAAPARHADRTAAEAAAKTPERA